jgi:hypothetical protein
MSTWWNDFKHSVLSGLSIPPAVYTVTVVAADSQYVNMQDAEVGLFLLAQADTVSGTWTITLEESDTGTGAGTALGTPVSVPITAAGVYVENFKRSKKYVRAILTETIAGTITAGISLHGLKKRV